MIKREAHRLVFIDIVGKKTIDAGGFKPGAGHVACGCSQVIALFVRNAQSVFPAVDVTGNIGGGRNPVGGIIESCGNSGFKGL